MKIVAFEITLERDKHLVSIRCTSLKKTQANNS